MFEMPSADMRITTTVTTTTNNNNTIIMNPAINPIRGPEFNISSKDVEELVLEIKENLRLSATTTMKAIPCSQNNIAVPCSHISRKSSRDSRASPYRIPGKFCCESNNCNNDCAKKNKRKFQQRDTTTTQTQDDPYELLQKLINEGSLVNEAVRRVQLGLTPKQRYFYESDEEASPVLRLCSQES